MGTRGLLFVRCCGRYYVYYNHLDSYPEGLGVAIVAEIPQDPEKYQEWLEAMRATYTKLSRQFEEHVLCVSAKGDHPEGMDSPSGRYAKSFLGVDDRLEVPPIQTVLPDVERWDIEWTYTLDLDRELLAVDNSAFFKLSKIPHEARWVDYLGEEHGGRRALRKNTPQELIGNATYEVKVNNAKKDKYQNIDLELDLQEIMRDLGEGIVTRETLLWIPFIAIHTKYRPLLDGFFLEWAPESFPFREIAFAILSLAAGEVSFESTHALNGSYQREGFFLVPDSTDQSNQQGLLPRFLHECHLPGVAPGSAPKETTFWFANVLICLTPRLDLVDVEEATVAEVVDAGLGQGRRSFRAIVFSILDVILIHVRVKEDGNVRVIRSPLMNLFYFNDVNSHFSNDPRTRSQNNSQVSDMDMTEESEEAQRSSNTTSSLIKSNPTITFVMMIRFFDAATDELLVDAKSSIFPNEILSTIMEFTDCGTYQTLAKVSPYCRDIYYRKLRLNDDYDVVGIDVERGPDYFLLEDRRSGKRIVSEVKHSNTQNWLLSPITNKDNEIELSPIIGLGDPNRRSIIDDISLVFSNVTPKTLPYERSEDMPVQEFFQYIQEPGGARPEQLFHLPDYFYSGSVEDAWGRYILGIIHENGKDSNNHRFVLINGASFRCLLPHGYRELTMDHFFCNGLHAFVRHGRDESPEEWDKTIKYAVRQLHRKETAKRHRFDFHVRGRPVIVAFTRKVKFFYYVYQCVKKPPVPDEARPHCHEIAERCTDAEPSRRLIQLIPGSEPLNLDNKESRVMFESWLQVFCKNEEMMTEYDPFTEKQVPLVSERTLTSSEGVGII